MKKLVRKVIGALGFDLVRKPENDTERRYQGFPDDSLKEKRFYNVGAGDFDHPYWTNIDYPSDWYSAAQRKQFIPFDAMELKPLPLPSNRAEAFYACHVIEHLSNDAVLNLAREAFRCLKPAGFLRFIAPDAELMYRAYKRNDLQFFYWADDEHYAGASFHRMFLNKFASQISQMRPAPDAPRQVTDEEISEAFANLPMEKAFDHFTEQCRYDPKGPGAHMNWWTEKKLGQMLSEAGFTTVYRSGYGQSLFSPMRDLRYFDSLPHFKHSLYMEAIKQTDLTCSVSF
jgi:predicted SAM-dependent methyltransferase